MKIHRNDMKKRRAMAYTCAVIMALLAVSAVIILSGKVFKIKGETVIAVETDISHYLSGAMTRTDAQAVADSLESFYTDNQVNTAVLRFDDCTDYFMAESEGTDVVKTIKDTLEDSKIQLYFRLNCEQYTADDIVYMANNIFHDYAVSAVILDNFTGTDTQLEEIRKTLHRGFRSVDLFVQTDDMEYLSSITKDSIPDGIICENLAGDDYFDIKDNAGRKTVLLHYTSPAVIADSFVFTNFASFDGAVVYCMQPEYGNALPINAAFTQLENLQEFNYSVSDIFELTYPTKDITTYYSNIFITGTGAKNNVIKVNGTDYPAADDGTFGVYLQLAEGDNMIAVSDGETTHNVTITKKSYSYTGGSSETPWDDSARLEKGRIVKTTSELTSVLSDPDDDSAIIGGLPRGTLLVVQNSVQTKRNGQYTYAYQLSNGGYVLASKVEIVNMISSDYETPAKPGKKEKQYLKFDKEDMEIYTYPQLTAASLVSAGNDEILTINTTGKTAVFSDFSDTSLKLYFADSTVENLDLPQSDMYKSYTVTQLENSVEVSLQFNFYTILGFDVKTYDDKVEIYLNRMPYVVVGNKPLQNITVLLDAGHGGKDSGALGVASVNGPLEKDVNLAVAKATKSLLENYGATVLMTREDDTFPSLDDRRNMCLSVKPDMFIAIHHNSMDYTFNSNTARGSECYYFTSQSKMLADNMCREVAAATNRLDRGEKSGYYYVTRTEICPSVLMEYSFIINPQEYSRTYSNMDIYRAAWGTLQAVLKGFPQTYEIQ